VDLGVGPSQYIDISSCASQNTCFRGLAPRLQDQKRLDEYLIGALMMQSIFYSPYFSCVKEKISFPKSTIDFELGAFLSCIGLKLIRLDPSRL